MRIDAVVFASNLFRRHVCGRADHSLTTHQRRCKIGHKKSACPIQKKIAGLNIAMHNMLAMSCFEGLGNRDDHRCAVGV